LAISSFFVAFNLATVIFCEEGHKQNSILSHMYICACMVFNRTIYLHILRLSELRFEPANEYIIYSHFHIFNYISTLCTYVTNCKGAKLEPIRRSQVTTPAL
jgi:hypothetical protein